MNKFAAVVLLSLLFATDIFAQHHYVVGRITDADTRQPLPAISVMVGVKGVVSDIDGYYKMPVSENNDSVFISFSCIGYEKLRCRIKKSGETTTLNIKLKPDQLWLKEVEIEQSRYDFGVKSAQMGAIALTPMQVKNTPMVFGEPDLLKTLQRMPGVQSGKDGNSGILVRGGGYDQNDLSIDGALLYSSEHLRGFISAVNPDFIAGTAFYRGAFPARYGGRLSSVIDITASEGDYQSYHGAVSAGLAVARAAVSGPIFRGRTSFSLAGRVSYFDMIFQPEVEKHYKKINAQNPYSDMNFWDINAKIAHKFSRNDKLTATFIMDRDRQKTTPSRNFPAKKESPYTIQIEDDITGEIKNQKVGTYHTKEYSATNIDHTSWGNMLGTLNWYHSFGKENTHLHTGASFTSYSYSRKLDGEQYKKNYIVFLPELQKPDSVPSASSEKTTLNHRSDVKSFRIFSDMTLQVRKEHTLNFGIDLRHSIFDPRRKVYSIRENSQDWCITYVDTIDNEVKTFYIVDHRDEYSKTVTDTLIGNINKYSSAAIYLSDRIRYGRFDAIVGLRASSYFTKHKSYINIEPRVSMSYLIGSNSSVKASYSLTTQGERLLTSTSIVSPSDTWVSVTNSIPPMKSHIMALSFNHQLPYGISVSVEGYYKIIKNKLSYLEGIDYSNAANKWENIVTLGNSRAYGVELFAQKATGNTTGWISYTWSKVLDKFDTPGKAIFGGKEHPSPTDRRHNLSINLSQRFNFKRFPGNHLDISVGYRYLSGRYTTIPDHVTYAGMIDMADHYYPNQSFYGSTISDIIKKYGSQTLLSDNNHMPSLPLDFFEAYMRYKGYSKLYNFKLPDESSLDISVSMTVKHLVGSSTFGIGVTNLLNSKNISDIYLGTDPFGDSYLKGICNFPIMPSISYTYSF